MHKIIDPAPSPTSQDWWRYNFALTRMGRSLIYIAMNTQNPGFKMICSFKTSTHRFKDLIISEKWKYPPPIYIWGSTDHLYWWSYWCSPLRTDSYLIPAWLSLSFYNLDITSVSVTWAPYNYCTRFKLFHRLQSLCTEVIYQKCR